MKSLVKKILPSFVLDRYHMAWAVVGNLIYKNPSKELIVIGVTGTKGKSTTCNMLWQILTEAGHKTGMTTTANFRIGDEEWLNNTKMTMQGRLRLQKLLRRMVDSGCEYAIVETSSEGILQHRHWGIQYQVAVFTNLSPEHLDRHGSFENYKHAKGELFKNLTGKSVIVANLDDKHVNYFLKFPAYKHVTFGFNRRADIQAFRPETNRKGSYLLVDDHPIQVPLLGDFNQYNALAALATARSLNISWDAITQGLKKFTYMPGRMEEIQSDKGFSVFVDYAHTVDSLEMVFKNVKPLGKRLIAVFGATGGGRDTGKRPKFAQMASNYADIIIVTDEDPYSEDPEKIIDDVYAGVDQARVKSYKVIDRGDAIRKAISLAQEGDIITVTGKGSEPVMATKQGLVPWDDREVVREALGKNEGKN